MILRARDDVGNVSEPLVLAARNVVVVDESSVESPGGCAQATAGWAGVLAVVAMAWRRRRRFLSWAN
ncbi:MAG: hypothetical protein A2341_02140 [Deltaproteobacteria bacterium RIFOXYB12_FULL_58_9]|nr:MAG: hypothetical protein A2341_02140 [Deltaproteobacteria bacterium RIFOXYB12_FULL_58_9]